MFVAARPERRADAERWVAPAPHGRLRPLAWRVLGESRLAPSNPTSRLPPYATAPLLSLDAPSRQPTTRNPLFTTELTTAAASRAETPARPRYERTSPCMKRIDRLGWSDALVLDAFGVWVGLRSDSAPLLRRAAARWTAVSARVVTVDEAGAPDVVVQGLLSLHSGARDGTAAALLTLAFYDGAACVVRSTNRDEVLDAL